MKEITEVGLLLATAVTRLYRSLIVNTNNLQITTIITTNMLYVWKYIQDYLKALNSRLQLTSVSSLMIEGDRGRDPRTFKYSQKRTKNVI